jgi:AraC family transcriptional regulator of adaptative response/methylated-DNA-[protein]-cysteine methyltransferase
MTAMDSRFRTPAARWAAVQRRDPDADAWFRYAVRTTGVYCRPSCPSRPARRENISFHATAAAAEAAGFRACKRCEPREARPGTRRAALIARLCRLIETAETPPTLAALSRVAHLSPFHLQREFRQATGLSPREYGQAARRRRLTAGLAAGAPVTRALHAAGYGSSARGYAEAPDTLGMTPRQFAAGGRGLAIRFGVAPSALGQVLAAATSRGLCAILLGDDAATLRADLAARFPGATIAPAGRDFAAHLRQVVQLVDQPRRGLPLALDIQGTAFQQRVWQALRAIPAGDTVSYAALAARIGAPRGARAVAAACAANALAVAVPCHRVVRGDGSLSGYRWGPERKAELLRREGADPARGPVPRR